MADEDPPWDPNNVTDPTSPFYAPPHYPRFKSPGPEEMPAAPAPGTCPHCGTAWATGKHGRARIDDFGVCGHCAGIVIFGEQGPRFGTYDEVLEAEQHPGVRFLMANYAPEWRRAGRGTEDPKDPPKPPPTPAKL